MYAKVSLQQQLSALPVAMRKSYRGFSTDEVLPTSQKGAARGSACQVAGLPIVRPTWGLRTIITGSWGLYRLLPSKEALDEVCHCVDSSQ